MLDESIRSDIESKLDVAQTNIDNARKRLELGVDSTASIEELEQHLDVIHTEAMSCRDLVVETKERTGASTP